MPEDHSTTVSEESATQKSLLKRMFGLYEIIPFFAGIHLGWRLFIVGIFLGLALIGATYIEEFLWMFLIIALVVVSIILLLKRFAGTKMGKMQDEAGEN